MVPLSWYIILSAVMFSIGVFGFLSRRNLIIIFMSIELMLNSVNISLIAFSHYLQSMRGQILVFFIITVAAAEAAIGLAILIAFYRNNPTVQFDERVECGAGLCARPRYEGQTHRFAPTRFRTSRNDNNNSMNIRKRNIC